MNYSIFIEKYKSKIKEIPTYEEYENIYNNVKETCKDVIIQDNYPINYLEGTTEFVCAYMLSICSIQDLMLNKYENKIRNAANKMLLSAPTQKNTANEAKKYIKDFLNSFNLIFDENENIDNVVDNIYNYLTLNGVKNESIMLKSNDNRLFSILSDGYAKCKFNENFVEFKNYIAAQTSSCYAREKIEIIRNEGNDAYRNQEYKYYDNPYLQKLIAIKTACGLYMNGYNIDNINRLNIDKIIKDNTYYEMIENNSAPKKPNAIKKYSAMSKKEKKDTREELKKKAIIIAIIFGALAAENIIYNVTHGEKDKKPEKPSYSVTETSSSYVPGSYLEAMYKNQNTLGRGR